MLGSDIIPQISKNQRWHLNIDDDWVRLTKFWEDVRSKCIFIYMYDMKKPSDNKKYIESLDQISASAAQSLPQIVVVESKKNVRMVSGVEDFTDSQANI